MYPNHFIPGMPNYLTVYAPPDAPGRSVYEVLDLPGPQLRRSMAVHEAGHAVVALQSPRVTVTRTGLRPGLGRLGSEADAGFTDWEGRGIKWLTAATVGAAGERAQQRWLRDNDLDSPARLWATEIIAAQDRREIVANAAAAGVTVSYDYDGMRAESDGSIIAGWWSIRFEAARTVSAAWDRILMLAEAIDRRGELSGEEAARLIGLPGSGPGGD